MAGSLQVGDEAFTATGDRRIVSEKHALAGTVPVFNLEVDATHTYFVGDAHILAHNACIPDLTRRQQTAIAQLRSGDDVVVRDISEARALLDNMPDVRPFNSGRFLPTAPAPRGTYRGDLINTSNPSAPYVHPPGSAPPRHALGPHYNIQFSDGKKAAIIIRRDGP